MRQFIRWHLLCCQGRLSKKRRSRMKTPQSSKFLYVAKLWLLVLLLTVPVMALAQYTFTTNPDGSLNIAQYTGTNAVVVIPNTTNGLPITSIGADAFFNNQTLMSVTVGTNVGSILDQAFSYSTLANVTLPASVTNIVFNTFQTCYSLTNISVATNDPVYSSLAGVLFNSNRTTLINFPGGKAGSYAIPDTVTDIALDAFFEATNVTSIAISTNVSTIEFYAFYDVPNLTAITVNTNNQYYSSTNGVLFDKSQDTLIAYPAGNIATSYIMPETVTNIGMEAFYGSRNLTSVTVGTNVVIVGNASFEYCPALASITLPNSVTFISGDAFAECSGLTNITIGTGVTNIQNQAFFSCPNVLAISVAAGNPAFTSTNGVLFNKNLTELYLYPAGTSTTAYAVPNTVTNIFDDAFMNAYYLSAVTLDTNLQTIGGSAFQFCFSLTSIMIPNSVTNLEFTAFYDDFSLTNVVIGSGVTTIGFDTFLNCPNLAGVYFASNAPAMNSDVFDNDTIATAYYLPGMTGWGATFDGIPTALWLPQIVASAVRTNQFSFYVDWASGQNVAVDECTNLFHPVWVPSQTNQFTSGAWYFTDARWTNYPVRFYRARMP
jgi:hypothetical protein